jgi:hypothetical protein
MEFVAVGRSSVEGFLVWLSPQQSGNPDSFARLVRFFLHSFKDLCLSCACEHNPIKALLCLPMRRGELIENGSMIRAKRQRGPDVWEFRWREPGGDGIRKHRRLVLGTVNQLADEAAARQVIAGLNIDINFRDLRAKANVSTFSQLVDHYRQRELEPDKLWKTHSTKVTYNGYLNKWILPRWGKHLLLCLKAGEVELWLRSLPSAFELCQDPKCDERRF